eukprot:4069154-Pyramimonas_sp.AAC.1
MLTSGCGAAGGSYTEKWGKYYTGEEPEVTENYPELATFRDIVFIFKKRNEVVENYPELSTFNDLDVFFGLPTSDLLLRAQSSNVIVALSDGGDDGADGRVAPEGEAVADGGRAPRVELRRRGQKERPRQGHGPLWEYMGIYPHFVRLIGLLWEYTLASCV